MLTGSIVAIVTPMREDGGLDLARFRSLMDWHIAEGTDGIVVVGTTGESPTVDIDEHKELIRIPLGQAAGRSGSEPRSMFPVASLTPTMLGTWARRSNVSLPISATVRAGTL